MSSKTGIIIVAGGSGRRMGTTIPKQFLCVKGRPILIRTLEMIHAALPNAQLVVVLPANEHSTWQQLIRQHECFIEHTVCSGGNTRFESVKSGLECLSDAVNIIGVHDGVRPLCTTTMIRSLAEQAQRHGSAIPVTPVIESIRQIDSLNNGATISSHPIPRESLRAVQTPQFFDSEKLRQAYARPFDNNFTDDASVYEASGFTVSLCEGEFTNIKITTPQDIAMAEFIIDHGFTL